MNSPRSRKRVHIFVTGRVQGVGFRYFTIQEAQRSGVLGWVRNTHDGRVETVAEGTEEQLSEFIAAMHRGPNFAHVTNCEVSWMEAEGKFSQFRVKF